MLKTSFHLPLEVEPCAVKQQEQDDITFQNNVLAHLKLQSTKGKPMTVDGS